MGAPQIPAARRPVMFLGVGALGLVVQIVVLSVLTKSAGWHYLPATILAVSLTVLHNFAWHEHWTWADRTMLAPSGRLKRLTWFVATTGVISIVGNLGLMAIYVGLMGFSPPAANLLAICSIGLGNFAAAEYGIFGVERSRSRGRLHSTAIAIPALTCILGSTPRAEAADLKPETIASWDQYVAHAEQRLERDLLNPRESLDSEWSDSDRRLLLTGGIPTVSLETLEGEDARIDVPSGSIHHWRGAMLIPHVTLDEVLQAAMHPVKQDDVLDLKVLYQDADSLRLYLKLIRKTIVTVTYNTEHDVHFRRDSPTRARCRSVAVRIAELDAAGTPDERERPVGQDRGFLWRLNAYWRYEQVGDGVMVDLESITLGREMPMLIGPLVRPVVNRIARESMRRTLEGFRQRFVKTPHP